MLLKQIKYFITVVDCQSFTEAAEELYLSQSAISQQIKALENDLGIALMTRKNRTFELTSAGEYFYHHGKEILQEVDDFKQETIKLGTNQELSLRIGYPKNYGAIELQQAIAQFSNLYPEVNISIVTGNHEDLFNLLVNHKIDFKLSEQRRMFNDNYVNYELKVSDCFVELSSSNLLSQKNKLTIQDLDKMSCILVASKVQEASEKDYYQNTLRLSKKFLYADNLEQARMLVLGNQGFLPIDAIGKLTEPMPSITRLPLFDKDKPVQRNYFGCWSKENTNYYVEEFAAILKQLLNT